MIHARCVRERWKEIDENKRKKNHNKINIRAKRVEGGGKPRASQSRPHTSKDPGEIQIHVRRSIGEPEGRQVLQATGCSLVELVVRRP